MSPATPIIRRLKDPPQKDQGADTAQMQAVKMAIPIGSKVVSQAMRTTMVIEATGVKMKPVMAHRPRPRQSKGGGYSHPGRRAHRRKTIAKCVMTTMIEAAAARGSRHIVTRRPHEMAKRKKMTRKTGGHEDAGIRRWQPRCAHRHR